MKSIIICLLLLSTYCYCEPLLGGWSTSDDQSLKQDCLNKALAYINGAQGGDDIQSQVSELVCRTQIVNGLNIKCSFTLREQKWECSYYKSFIQTLDTQLEQCKQKENEPVPEEKQDEQGTLDENEKGEQLAVLNDDEKEEQVVRESPTSNENEDDNEAKIDAINKQMSEQNANNEEEHQQ